MTRNTNPALLVFSDDWGRHPSSCQHLTRRLLGEHSAIWVNTIGMRPPRLDAYTLRRGCEKMKQWVTRVGGKKNDDVGELLPDGLSVVNPQMWPWFRTRVDRWLNRNLLERSLSRIIQQHRGDVVAVTTIPVVADLIGRLPVSRWVYYCVDDFSVWPGLDQRSMANLESDLIDACHDVIVVSETLQRKLANRGREAQVLTHGVDLDFWRAGSRKQIDALEGCERPLVVFWGVIDRRMDADFVQRLADRMTHGTIVLVGPEQDPEPQIFAHPRVVHVPPLPLAALPDVAAAASVLIMPYRDEAVTRAMQPLKLKEYLATDRPVVVRSLPVTEDWSDCLDLAGSADEFARLVCRRLETGLPIEQQSARARLESESWKEKARIFRRWVLAEQ